MKNTVLCLVFLIVSFACNGQDERLIYKEVINEFVLKLRPPNVDYGPKTTITTFARPAYNTSPDKGDYANFKEKYEKLGKETFIDFVSKSHLDVPFNTISIPNIEFVVLKSDSTPKLEDLAARYPHWIYSIVEFSNVGMNTEKTQALIYYSFNSGPGVGGGAYIVYEKKRKKWKQKAVIPAWAA